MERMREEERGKEVKREKEGGMKRVGDGEREGGRGEGHSRALCVLPE